MFQVILPLALSLKLGLLIAAVSVILLLILNKCGGC
jgi:hypothetical protein